MTTTPCDNRRIQRAESIAAKLLRAARLTVEAYDRGPENIGADTLSFAALHGHINSTIRKCVEDAKELTGENE